jgi:hypothetical protein
MIISVDELKQYIETELDDSVLEAMLQALESLIRKYTNNNFQNRLFRFTCPVMAQKLFTEFPFVEVGDTVQISESIFSNGLYTIKEIDGNMIALNKRLYDENEVLVTKIEYPIDVKMGVVNLLRWDLEHRSKVGIQSETISRHSVTYFNMDGDNSSLGYPKSLLGFLKPYMKARF